MISPEMWDKIYFKGSFDSIHIKKNQTHRHTEKEKVESPQVIYMKDPINFELAGLAFPFDNQEIAEK